MSGKPSPEGVSIFRSAVARMTIADERIGALNEEIRERSVELQNQQKEFENAKEQMFKAMEAMDVRSPGNAGWEGRVAYFYRELHRQSSQVPITR